MVVISLDRLSSFTLKYLLTTAMPFRMFAVLFPISHRSNTSRTKMMLMVAWILGPLCALPQSFIFTIRSHPLVPDYHQCTSIGSFETSTLVHQWICYVDSYKYLFRSFPTSCTSWRWPSLCPWLLCSSVSLSSSTWCTRGQRIHFFKVEILLTGVWLRKLGCVRLRSLLFWFSALFCPGLHTISWVSG